MYMSWPTVWVILAVVPVVLCCREKEYTARDGQCCPMCSQGSVVVKDCTVDLGTRCGPCKPGTYMNIPNGLDSCFLCKSCSSDHGLFMKQNCTVTSDTVCAVLSGYYCQSGEDESGCSHAVKHSHCTPGQGVQEPGTSQTDTVCQDCKQGQFSPDGKECRVWTNCSENEVRIQEGDVFTDAVCSRSPQRNHYAVPSVLLLWMLSIVYVVFHSRCKN